jgi:hypothetical protein
MAKGTMDAAESNAHTPRTALALEKIQEQLDSGAGQVSTGIDISMERQAEDAQRLLSA